MCLLWRRQERGARGGHWDRQLRRLQCWQVRSHGGRPRGVPGLFHWLVHSRYRCFGVQALPGWEVAPPRRKRRKGARQLQTMSRGENRHARCICGGDQRLPTMHRSKNRLPGRAGQGHLQSVPTRSAVQPKQRRMHLCAPLRPRQLPRGVVDYLQALPYRHLQPKLWNCGHRVMPKVSRRSVERRHRAAQSLGLHPVRTGQEGPQQRPDDGECVRVVCERDRVPG